MDLKSSNPRLHRLALHLAVSGVPAGSHGLADHHQVPAPLAKCLQSSLPVDGRRRCRRLAELRVRALRGETAESLAHHSVAFSRPDPGVVPLLPSVRGRFRGRERETGPALTLSVQDEVQRVVRVDAAPVARAVGGDLRDRVAAAVAALLLLAEDEHRRALEHLASWHRVRGRCSPLRAACYT